jgi:DNA-binding FrmR family transcriptional regulator
MRSRLDTALPPIGFVSVRIKTVFRTIPPRGAINGLMAEVMEDHIRLHVVATEGESENQRAQAAEELIEVVRSYLK